MTTDQLDLDALDLPCFTHAQLLTGRDVLGGHQLAYPVVWADRIDRTCPRCDQPIERVVGCPVMLDTGAGAGGQILEWNRQHGCGEWLSVDWQEVQPSLRYADPTVDDVLAAARELADRRAADVEAERERICTALRTELQRALARLQEPLAPDETREQRAEEVTNGQQDPGVYCEDGRWMAWDYDPDDRGDVIIVSASDLTETAQQA